MRINSSSLSVGFTGTRNGMTKNQKIAVFNFLGELMPYEVHHGDCVGSDAEFHLLAEFWDVLIVVHPPDDPKSRAWCNASHSSLGKPYLERNKDIVEESHILIATPDTANEKLRSGTWSTIRYAKKLGKKVIIIEP